MSIFLDRKEYSGDLFTQLELMESFVKNHISLRGEIKGLQRTDTYELPEAALREALINAVIHRDYTNQGRDIKVGVYDDIVNIVSPGGFPNTLTAEALVEGRSEIRNRVVARIFKGLGYIEQWGSGIQRIKAACTGVGLREPLVREKGDFVDVEFYRPGAGDKGTTDMSGKVSDTGEKVSDTKIEVSDTRIEVSDITVEVADNSGKAAAHEQRILNFLREHQTITSKYVETIIGVKEARARRILNSMTDKGFVEKQGNARSTYYVLAHPPQ